MCHKEPTLIFPRVINDLMTQSAEYHLGYHMKLRCFICSGRRHLAALPFRPLFPGFARGGAGCSLPFDTMATVCSCLIDFCYLAPCRTLWLIGDLWWRPDVGFSPECECTLTGTICSLSLPPWGGLFGLLVWLSRRAAWEVLPSSALRIGAGKARSKWTGCNLIRPEYACLEWANKSLMRLARETVSGWMKHSGYLSCLAISS